MLFGSKWTIQFLDKIPTDDPSSFQFGLTDGVQRIIKVATKDREGNDFPENEIRLTVLHEVVHAIFDTGQYDNSDEPMVEWIARCMYAILEQKIL